MAIIDVHGDTARTLLGNVHNKDRSRLVYVSSSIGRETNTSDYCAVINPFEVVHNNNPEIINTYAQELADAIAEILEGSTQITVQMSVLLKPAIFTTMLSEKPSLETLARFFLDKDGQNEDLLALGRQSPVPLYRQFFQHDWNSAEYILTKRSIRTKLLYFLADPMLSNMLCGRSTVNLEQCFNQGKVVIFCLPKSAGKHTSSVFSRLMIAFIHAIMLRRDAIEDKKARKPLYLFLDEYQNLVTRSLAEGLAECRKYGLHTILATQNMKSIEPNLRKQVMVNCAIKMVSLTDAEDKAMFAKELDIPVETLSKLQAMQFIMRKMDGKHDAFKFRVPILGSRHFLSKAEKKDLLHYFVHQSGIYTKNVSLPAPSHEKNTTPKPVKKTGKKKDDPFDDNTQPLFTE